MNDIVNAKGGQKRQAKKKGILYELMKNKFIYALALPAIIYTFIYGYATLPYLVIAFEKYSYKTGLQSPFVGLKNFVYFFKSSWAWIITRNTIMLNLLFIITGTVFAVLLAILLNEVKNKFFLKISQSMMLFPYFISWVIVSYILFGLLNTDSGLINSVLTSLGYSKVSFYTEPKYWYPILMLLRLWKGAGYGSVIYLACIVGMDDSYFEAAAIDGATRLQRIMYITVPLLLPTVSILTLMDIGRIFSADFGMFYAIIRDNGSLMKTAEVIDTYVFRTFKNTGDPSLSMAINLYQSAVGFILVLGSNSIIRKYYPQGSLF